METPLYLYISSGEQSVFYTLKLYFKFQSRGKTLYSSRFVKSLSVDLDEAIKKAHGISRRYNLPLREPEQASKWRMKSHAAKHKVYGSTLLSFGKHKGLPVKQVMADDPGYCRWLCENHTGESRSVSAVVSYLKANMNLTDTASKSQTKTRDALKRTWYSKSRHLGKIGETVTLTARVNKAWTTEGKWGVSSTVVLETVDGHHIKIQSRSSDAFKFDEEEWYEVSGQVTTHTQFKYIKQTLMNRIKIIRHLDHIESRNIEKERQQKLERLWSEL